jgi:hypothetical protein
MAGHGAVNSRQKKLAGKSMGREYFWPILILAEDGQQISLPDPLVEFSSTVSQKMATPIYENGILRHS